MDFDFDDMDAGDQVKVKEINVKFLEVLMKAEVQAIIVKLRDECELNAQFLAKRNEKLSPFLDPLFQAEYVDLDYIENQNWSYKDEDEEIGDQFKRITELFYMGKIGPLEIDKGDCVQMEGGETGVALSFKQGAYNVRFYPDTLKSIAPDQLKALDKQERYIHILDQVLGVLSAPETQAVLTELRKSSKKEEFEEAKMAKVTPMLAALGKHHGEEFSAVMETCQTMSHSNEKLAEQLKQVEAPTAYALGPLELTPGDCVEIADIDAPEQKHLSGKSGIVSSWFADKALYEVRVIGDMPAYLKPGQVRKIDELEQTKAIQQHIMTVLGSPEAQGALDGLRAKCANMIQYSKKLPETMKQVTMPALASFGVTFEWYSKQLETHTKDRELRSMAKRIDTLTSFGKIGPWGLEKGAFYEAYDIKDGEKKAMNGTAVLILSWDNEKGAYDVTPVGKPAETTQLPAENLRPVADKTFASKDEAAKFQKELQEIYDSSAAQDAIKKLKSDKPDQREYLTALKPALLELQKPLLKKYGFREDLVGMNHVQRALAPYEADGDFAKKTAELEKFGSQEMRFDGKVALVTGGGRGLGRAYSKLLAARGAKVVVNNRTGSKADEVVNEILAMGGTAVAEYSDVATSPDSIVPFVIEKYGKIDILVANAGQLDDHRFEIMKTEYFTNLIQIHVYGHYKVLKAAWPHMVGQKYGRVVLIASESGLHGNFGQSNYGACKMAMTSFGQTMAMEGFPDGVLTNIVCPVGLTRMTNDLRPMPFRAPEWELMGVAQPSDKCVAYLAHESCKTTAGIFRAEEGHIQSLRWQADDGFVTFEPGNPLALESLVAGWPAWGKWEKVQYPGHELHSYRPGGKTPADLPSGSKALPKGGDKCKYNGRVAIITGAGRGIGRSVATFLAARGCQIVVHDTDVKKADKTVADIKAQGGEAVADYSDLYAAGEKVVETAMNTYDQVDIVVCAATKRQDASFADSTFEQFSDNMNTDLVGHIKILQAAWPQMFMGRFGRIVFVCSDSAYHGAKGQFSYGAAKGSFLAVGQTLAMEGYKYNLLTNCIANVDDLSDADYEAKQASIIPCIGFLCHEGCKATAGMFTVKGNKVSSLRWQSDEAFADFDVETGDAALETVAAQWQDVARFSKVIYPGQMVHMSYR